MTGLTFFAGVIALCFGVLGYLIWKENIKGLAVACWLLTAMASYAAYHGTTDEYAADMAAADEAERKRRIPHVIREVDGCKVYGWEAGGRWHYFTRCQNSRTSTEQNWQQCSGSGKHRTCKEMSETIEVR